ncbi:MAG: murein L,D-transpeptidase catalytic domain family protein [Proteobacteria bacterium]|nr:murein L,D-transpeptidase catalytic domain family protein [Pseudomonadota bacterium]
MAEPFTPHRRQLLRGAIAGAGVAAVAASAVARPASAQALGGGDAALIAAARAGLQRAGGAITHTDLVGVADFSQPSRLPRLHLVDIANGRIESLLVAHGRGSDPGHTGWVKTFSNVAGSAATSEGCYLTGDDYVGQHGRSMRLKGLEPTNSNAEARAIVVHEAWYVGPEIVRAHGVLGRSEGCLAVSQADLPKVLQRLGPGRLIVARKL